MAMRATRSVFRFLVVTVTTAHAGANARECPTCPSPYAPVAIESINGAVGGDTGMIFPVGTVSNTFVESPPPKAEPVPAARPRPVALFTRLPVPRPDGRIVAKIPNGDS